MNSNQKGEEMSTSRVTIVEQMMLMTYKYNDILRWLHEQKNNTPFADETQFVDLYRELQEDKMYLNQYHYQQVRQELKRIYGGDRIIIGSVIYNV